MKIKDMVISAYENSRMGLFFFKRKWRRNNPINDTFPVNCFPIEKVNIGEGTYGPLKVISYRYGDCNIIIGKFCSIAKETTFLLGGEHSYKTLLTYPVEKYIFHEKPHTFSKGDIVIEDDVWIGYGVTILSGVHIGRGAVIAAGAVVYKDVPAYAVWGEGRVLKYRFSSEVRERLLKIEFEKIDEKFILNNRELFEREVQENDKLELL